MRVTAHIYAPPGRGEYIEKHFDMADSAMPASQDEFIARSTRALKHFWPRWKATKAKTLKLCEKSTVVEGESWRVEWATDAHIAAMDAFTREHIKQSSTLGDLFKAAAFFQPLKELSL